MKNNPLIEFLFDLRNELYKQFLRIISLFILFSIIKVIGQLIHINLLSFIK